MFNQASNRIKIGKNYITVFWPWGSLSSRSYGLVAYALFKLWIFKRVNSVFFCQEVFLHNLVMKIWTIIKIPLYSFIHQQAQKGHWLKVTDFLRLLRMIYSLKATKINWVNILTVLSWHTGNIDISGCSSLIYTNPSTNCIM